MAARALAFHVQLSMRPVHKKLIALLGLLTIAGAAWLALASDSADRTVEDGG